MIEDYGMFSVEGNRVVTERVEKLKKQGLAPKGYMDQEFYDKYFKDIKKIFGEVDDTAVRENVFEVLIENKKR